MNNNKRPREKVVTWRKLLGFFLGGVVLATSLRSCWLYYRYDVSSVSDAASYLKTPELRHSSVSGLVWLAWQTDRLHDPEWQTFEDWFQAVKPILPEYVSSCSARWRNPFPGLLTAPRYGHLDVFPSELERPMVPLLWEDESFLTDFYEGVVPVLFLDGSMRTERMADVKRRVGAIREGRPLDPWSGTIVYPPLWSPCYSGLLGPPRLKTGSRMQEQIVTVRISTPSMWSVYVRTDGSGIVSFGGLLGSGRLSGDGASFPKDTFDFIELRDRARAASVPTGSVWTHYVVTLIPQEGALSTSRFCSDSRLIGSLFSRAMSRADKTGTRLEELYKTRPPVPHSNGRKSDAVNGPP